MSGRGRGGDRGGVRTGGDEESTKDWSTPGSTSTSSGGLPRSSKDWSTPAPKSTKDWSTPAASSSTALPKSSKDWSTPAGSTTADGGGQWGRLKPPPQGKEFGFVSKGDTSLKDENAQERFYEDIVTRFIGFCKDKHDDDREKTFLSFKMPPMVKNGGPCIQGLGSNEKGFSDMVQDMRKLREALLSTGRSDEWAINVYLFFTKASILMRYKEGYRPPIGRLLDIFADPKQTVLKERLPEVAGYYMLDIAIAQEDYNRAYMVKAEYNITDRCILDGIKAIIHFDYRLFRKTLKEMSLYQARILEFAEDRMRASTLTSLQKSYFTLPKATVEQVFGLPWGKVSTMFSINWELDEADGKSTVTIRKVKSAAAPAKAAPKPPAPALTPKPDPVASKKADVVVPTRWDEEE
ncbi:hypothetical protein BJ508DRAFT_366497 [Ascobolus immersus RN42]|uniref:Uncharacterized protein n=1 Tax=Ascobolus immersus RN42 TaxID=1160509 RepID=A0A3N4HPH2_ASCIM|nr:hypothetical protein BJ508DRAFT_366497 [Ascobolus immersus RN42]